MENNSKCSKTTDVVISSIKPSFEGHSLELSSSSQTTKSSRSQVVETAVPKQRSPKKSSNHGLKGTSAKGLNKGNRCCIPWAKEFIIVVLTVIVIIICYVIIGTKSNMNLPFMPYKTDESKEPPSGIEDTSSIIASMPTMYPSFNPTFNPTFRPSFRQSIHPSFNPSFRPSFHPSFHPSFRQSFHPSFLPSYTLSYNPTSLPSNSPTKILTRNPTVAPVTPHPTSSPTSSPTNDFIEFFVMGDTPYDDNDARILKQQLKKIPRSTPFIYHLGDINYALETGCNEKAYMQAKEILLTARSPLFITPGDNDWNDCPYPDEAWMFWRRHFRSFEDNWKHSLSVRRMKYRPENISFFMDFVLFIGINLVGGSFVTRDEWSDRLSDNLRWTIMEIKRHRNILSSVVIFAHGKPRRNNDDYFEPLGKMAKRLDVPILYLHGDGHEFYVSKGVYGANNLWDVQVDNGGKARPLRVTITKGKNNPFEFKR